MFSSNCPTGIISNRRVFVFWDGHCNVNGSVFFEKFVRSVIESRRPRRQRRGCGRGISLTDWRLRRTHMRLRGLGRLKRWYLKSKSFVEFRVAILMYHRVTQADSDPFSLRVTPEHFAEHLQYLRSQYPVLSLAELKKALKANSLPRRAVVVTFDDGYADNRWHALPLLERYEVPST